MIDDMTQTRTHFVTRHDQRGVAVLTLAYPPRNGLEPEVVAELQALAEMALLAPEVRALVITGAGPGFASGADLRGNVARPDPALSSLCRTIEDAHKPTVAAIHGSAIGPGLELALACHFRVAQVDTQFSFPDIALGWLPAAGGIQRLTRIVGGRAAMSALLGGRVFGTPRAERLGLLDIVTPGAPLEAAITRALQVNPRPTRNDATDCSGQQHRHNRSQHHNRQPNQQACGGLGCHVQADYSADDYLAQAARLNRSIRG